MRSIDGRTLSDASLHGLRAYAATLATHARRMRKRDIATAIGLSRRTVSRWLNRYIIDTSAVDVDGLVRRGMHKQRGRGLTFAQELKLREIVCGESGQLQLDGVRWSRRDVQIAAQRAFGVELNHHLAGNYLEAWGVEPRKPTPQDLEADILRWLQECPDSWWRVSDVARGIGCSMQQANHALMTMAEAEKIRAQVTEHKDKRHRVRIKTMYRAREDDASQHLAALFGMVAHPTVGGRVVRGRDMQD